ncbi:MAG: hypothetical protein V2J16_01660 [Thermoleophilia bacterium]|jgi:hypothetical protein|nr:hypothetical protein [Thermoleophilia bacterium]
MDDIVDLVSSSDDELRALITQLEAEEREISRRRRILQGKLDILRAELVMRLQRAHSEGEAVIDAVDVDALSRILAGKVPEASADEGDAAAADPSDAASAGDEPAADEGTPEA